MTASDDRKSDLVEGIEALIAVAERDLRGVKRLEREQKVLNDGMARH